MTALRFIAGSGRSGTTWVLDSLAKANNLRPVFEPLNPYVSRIGSRYALKTVLPGEDHPELRQHLEEAFAGRRDRLWTQFRRQKTRLFPPMSEIKSGLSGGSIWRRWAKFLGEIPELARLARNERPIVKCIWANQMVGWISEQFGCRVVLVVRHPGAVIESELRSEWRADMALAKFKRDAGLRIATGDRYDALLDRAATPPQQLAVRWIVENQWVIERSAEFDAEVVFYEDLLTTADLTWTRLCRTLDLAIVPDSESLSRPSQQSDMDRQEREIDGSSLDNWMSGLTPKQTEEIQQTLDEARFDIYSMNDPLPKRNSIAAPGAAR